MAWLLSPATAGLVPLPQKGVVALPALFIAGPQLIANSKQVVGLLPGVASVEVKIVLDPPWTPDKMTDEARDQLGIFRRATG